ncbi:MAG: hypothetical protein JSS72_04700 [Armatimonadetes bacterium]|nr:hypothetical protein [Armatimonadota bacterium]
MKRKRGGFALLILLAAVVIILIIMVVQERGTATSVAPTSAPPPSARPDGQGTTVMGGAMVSAKDEVCKSNLNQLRQIISVARTSSDEPPRDLGEMRAPASIMSCPVGHEPYVYDPQTGRVYCPHPGHGGY